MVKMSSPIDLLSPDLLQAIIKLIFETSPSTLSSLTLVSKCFYSSAYLYKHRHQTFALRATGDDKTRTKSLGKSRDKTSDKTRDKSQDAIKSLLEDRTKIPILKVVREITVNSCVTRPNRLSNGDFEDLVWDSPVIRWGPFVDLISILPRLESVTVDGDDQVPLLLLEALEKHHRKAELHIKNWRRRWDDDDHNVAAELALSRSPNLRSINAAFSNANGLHDMRLEAFKRIIALSPNLRDVDISEGQNHCLGFGYSWEEMVETQRRRKLFEVGRSAHSIISLKFRGALYDYVDILDGSTDLSKLESLDIPNPNFFASQYVANSRFRSLKHLLVGRSWLRGPALESFLGSCSPLETLALADRGNEIQLSTILSSHGPSLRVLALHHEITSKQNNQPLLTLPEVQGIGQLCPLLEEITLGEGQWTETYLRSVFAILATFKNLRIVRVYLPLELIKQAARKPRLRPDEEDEEDEEAKIEESKYENNTFNPIDDDAWLENVWSFIVSEKQKNQTRPWTELHVRIGWRMGQIGGDHPARPCEKIPIENTTAQRNSRGIISLMRDLIV